MQVLGTEPEGGAPSDSAVDRLRQLWREVAGSVQGIFVRTPEPDLPLKDVEHIRAEVASCIGQRGGDVAARARAAALGRAYLALNENGRREFLRLLATFEPDTGAIVPLAKRIAAGEGDAAMRRSLREALDVPASRIFRQFNSLPSGIKFLVDLRADLLRWKAEDQALAQLEGELRDLLASWFDIGFLALRRITWDAPASLLERLAQYEAVHEMRDWQDLKDRLDAHRRCYAFFHPIMPDEPLIFIEIALIDAIPSAIAPLLDRRAPLGDEHTATVAVFYSISNCQKGLAGISFGDALIKRVVADLIRDLPQLKTFVTLSPVPGFMTWLRKRSHADDPLLAMLSRRSWHRDSSVASTLEAPLLRLCAHYLAQEKRAAGSALDPVAHFHLTNGARLERLNWLADRSQRGLRESAGIMANYLYQLDKIDENHQSYEDGRTPTSSTVKSLAG